MDRKDTLKYLLFFVLVLASRLPFIGDGCGLDGDAWSVAIASSNWRETGLYEASRFPGYPVQEFLGSLLDGSCRSLNLLTAIISSIGILFFVMALRVLRFRSAFLAGAALAAVPIVFIHSTTAIDYNIALAFILVSLFFTVKDLPVLAGAFLGLAIGTRITSGAMLLPFALMILRNDGVLPNLKRIFRLLLPALLVGMACYLPVYNRYGSGFFTFYDVPYPSIPKVLYKFCFEVWGPVGFTAIIAGVLMIFIPERWTARNYLFPRAVNEKFVIAWLVAVDLYIIAFLKLPMESGYLIPIIPFVIMLFGKYLVRPAFGLFCALLVLSPFFVSISPTERLDAGTPSAASFHFSGGGEELLLDVWNGPVFSYKSRRENGIGFTSQILESTDTVSRKALMITGRWYNQLVKTQGDTVSNKVVFASYITEPELLHYYAKGYELYYLPRQDYYNKLMKGIDPGLYGALPYVNQKAY